MEAWDGFFMANAGISASLAGLVFVGISINLDRILKAAALADRCLEAIIPLLMILLVSIFASVPDPHPSVVGIAFLVVALPAWAAISGLVVKYARENPPDARLGPKHSLLARVILGQVATLPFLIGGIATIVWGTDGLYIAVIGIAGAYLLAFVNAWVLLVEIDR